MKIWVKLLILILVFTGIVSCTEEISDEIQNTATATSTSSVDYTTKSIRLVHKMDESLSFYMHKAGDLDADCELKAPTGGFDSGDYNYQDSNYNVDCVLEAEELDIQMNGLGFELQIDDQLCEYVAYYPYSILRFQPGETERHVYQVECDSECSDDPDMTAICGSTYDEYYGDTTDATPADGNTIVDSQVGTILNDTSSQKLCYYDHSDDYGDDNPAPNCDEGKIVTHIIQFTGDSGYDSNTDTPECHTTTITTNSESECGGNQYACLDGPIVDESEINYTEGKRSYIFENEDLESFTNEWQYPDLINNSNYLSSMKYANYSRICADTDTNKSSDTTISTLVSLVGYQSEDIRGYDTTTYPLTKSLVEEAAGSYKAGTTESLAYADNYWRGLTFTSPYYGFVCFDKALDVKAQIRLYVREWDRSFENTNITINTNSDVYLNPATTTAATDAYMDTRDQQQPNTGQVDVYWNDFDDLDDFAEDNNVWNTNTCVDSTSAFSSNNFPNINF